MVRIIVNHRKPHRTSHGAGRRVGRGDVLSGTVMPAIVGIQVEFSVLPHVRARVPIVVPNANRARVADTIRIRHRVCSQLATMSRALPLQPTAAPLVRKPVSPFEQRVHRRSPNNRWNRSNKY